MLSSLKSRLAALALPVLLLGASGACSSSEEHKTDTTVTLDAAKVSAVLENYAVNLHQAYSDSITDAQALKLKLRALIDAPSAATLKAAQDEWLKSRERYMLTEGARFYDGPIDIEDGKDSIESLLNGWPLDEAQIDYVQHGGVTREDYEGQPSDGYQFEGLVNDPAVELTPAELDDRNAEGSDENITAGYHAIEFLLWGQAMEKTGPGKREHTDFVPLTEGEQQQLPSSSLSPADYTPEQIALKKREHAKRRGEYLIAAVDGIIANLEKVRDAWKPDAAYRKEFVAGGSGSISKALSGLGRFSKGEMAGERINAGLESKARRDQHNCFSSTTLIDYERDARGVLGMYLGNYGNNDGPGFDELVKAHKPEVDSKMQALLNDTVNKLKSMNAAGLKFEDAIEDVDNGPKQKQLIELREAFRAQGDQFAYAADALGISLEIPEENE